MSYEVQVGQLPTCDLQPINHPEEERKATYDGRTRAGPWAYMCSPCFGSDGVGLGTGVGQRLVLRKGS